MLTGLPVFIILTYSFVIAILALQLAKIKEKNKTRCNAPPRLSIIIPVKNEMKNIERLVNEFTNQSIGMYEYEIIFADDNSTDGTQEKLLDINRKRNNIKVVDNKQSGKKHAMINAAKVASGKFLIFTDADTIHDDKFVESWIDFICNNPDMLLSFGNVAYRDNKKNFITAFQNFEFSVLQAVGIATSALKTTAIGSAANMAVNKSFFLSKIKEIKPEIPSGDDMFLLIAGNKQDRKKVKWNTASYVYTHPKETFSDFIKQRIRWVGKSKYYDYFPILVLSSLTFLANISFITLVFSVSFSTYFILLFKVLSEIGLLCVYRSKILKKKPEYNFFYIIMSAILYPFYATVVIPVSLILFRKNSTVGFN